MPMSIIPPACNNGCAETCDNVFDRVHVSYLIAGGTTVLWDLINTFADPLPYTFQLQVGVTGSSNSGDWIDVGAPVVDGCIATDPEQRVHGKTQFTHYRVKLVTSEGTYYSDPTSSLGILGMKEWRMAKELLRQAKLQLRYGNASEGYLLKRRLSGVPCPECLDLQTDDVSDPSCEFCYGTGYRCGYYYPIPCVWAALNPRTHRAHVDDGGRLGTISDIRIAAQMVVVPPVDEYDVWINKATDDRYYIHNIQNVIEQRGVPILANVELRLAEYTEVVYTIPIPDQIESKG